MGNQKANGYTDISLFRGRFGGIGWFGRGLNWSFSVHEFAPYYRTRRVLSIEGLAMLGRLIYRSLRGQGWQERQWKEWEREHEELMRQRREAFERYRQEQERLKARSRSGGKSRQERKRTRQEAPQDDYAFALELLGLAEPFTVHDLSAAFRKAMMGAHPDAGGSHDEALAVNYARDIIRQRKGWS